MYINKFFEAIFNFANLLQPPRYVDETVQLSNSRNVCEVKRNFKYRGE